MLCNESVDEDLEHFEDIADENEEQGKPAQTRTNDADKVVSGDDRVVADSDSSSDEEDPDSPDSEDVDFDEPDNLFVGDGLDNFIEPGPASNSQQKKSEVANVGSLLPGGYNPRHREPSFWYFHILDTFV